MKKVVVLMMVLFSVFTLTACEKSYTNINNDELREMFENKDNYQFIDVRTPTEYYGEHISEFTINLDYYLLENDHSLIDDLNLDKSKPVVIMCNSGNRSVDASIIFADQGFSEVYNLTNGIQGWDGETE